LHDLGWYVTLVEMSPRACVVGFLAMSLFGCGSDDSGGGPAGAGGAGNVYGGVELASLTDDCEGISGLNGQAILDQKMEQVTTSLGYIGMSGTQVGSTDLTLDITWPAQTVATCYAAFTDPVTTAVTEARVGIRGLGMHFVTSDGKFDETVGANAWLSSGGGTVGLATAVGSKSRTALTGTWVPFPDYDNGGTTLTFVNRLTAAGQSNGNIGLSNATPAALDGGVFAPGNAMALWPAAAVE
jgi:hypothetical protein